MTEALPDGIYPHLDDADYFAQDALGSSDLKELAKPTAADWWYGSRHNPHHERKSSDEMDFGSALHALLLEGDDAYAQRVCIKPETYPDAKTGELKPWHGAAGFCKAWEAERAGKLILDVGADRRVRHMAALIENHPELGESMRGGMSEVAMLWTDEATGLRFRAKFDKLLPKFVVDLKTFGGDSKGLSTTQQVLSLVAQRSMDVQRYLYFQAREKMAGLIEAGKLHGATKDEADWLKRVASVEDWKWTWIFYRRRDDDRGYAPAVKPIHRSHFDVTFESGRQKVEVAIANYQTLRGRFGTEVPWAIIENGEEPEDHQFPAWIKNVSPPITLPEIEDQAA